MAKVIKYYKRNRLSYDKYVKAGRIVSFIYSIPFAHNVCILYENNEAPKKSSLTMIILYSKVYR